MEKLRALLAKKSWDRDSVTVRGTRELRFKENRSHYLGAMVDEYVPVITELSLATSEKTVTLAPSSQEFVELAEVLEAHVTLPLFTRLLEPLAMPIREVATFAAQYGKLDRHFDLDEEEIEAMMRNDEVAHDDIVFRRFQLSAFAEAHPQYDRALYEEVLDSRSGRYRVHDLTTFFGWHARSSALFDKDGDFTPEAAERLNALLDKWEEAGTGIEHVRYQAPRALSAHPMHEARIHDYVEAEFARRGMTAAPAALRP
ncbi:hypothetical protein [Rhizobium sp. BK176]|uniref:hypothetical protein n=1 Tax=Rhizobium sp. BK176 TaxID=2587071 RepID=UPI002169D415|nr:hypothetical protein [Rhizobium sp. BK176]MCS4089589.1 hypothetical protein [Rhizobium sp. BK176]